MMKNKKKVLLRLFISTLYLSTFTFGGGYVIVSLLQKNFVDEYHWIENDEMHLGQSRSMGRLLWDISWQELQVHLWQS